MHIQMKGNHIDYFPIMRAICLEDEVDKEENLKKQFDELKSMVQAIHERLDQLKNVGSN